MEAQSRILWDFLRLSYQRGLMDDLMALGDLLNPNMDLVDALEKFEEAVMAKDLEPFTAVWQEQIQPLIKSMTNAQSIDALCAILQTLHPLLAKLAAGSVNTAFLQTIKAVTALKPHIAVLLRKLGPLATPYVQKLVRENSGKLLGQGLNAISSAILQTHTHQPKIIEGIFTDLFQTLNANQFGEAMEIVLGGFLDQRPKIVRWSLGTTFTRIKKRFARS